MKCLKRINIVMLLLDMLLGMLCLASHLESSYYTVAVNPSDVVKGEDDRELTDEKKIALTFDDGPHPYYTEQLLDGLKERGVHATFFVTGEHAQLHPDIIKRMQEDA